MNCDKFPVTYDMTLCLQADVNASDTVQIKPLLMHRTGDIAQGQ